MKLQLLMLSGFLGLSVLTTAQNNAVQNASPANPLKRCGTRMPSPEWDAWFNQKVREKKDQGFGQERVITLTIPVIVHIIHGGQGVGSFPNISAAQVNSQIKVLNDDFAGKGFNAHKLATTGFSLVGAANTNITFCLAQLDPGGMPLTEPGIERIDYNTKGWQNPATPGAFNNFYSLMENTIKPGSIWDPTQYFNIWVSDVNPGVYVLGYATFPGGSNLAGVSNNLGTANTDGIWIWGRSFGSTGTLDPIYNKGRTAVHEVGHWLGLRHIGGDSPNPSGDCAATDYCDDTPSQKGGNAGGANGQNYGAPVYPLHVNACGSPYGDMFMNFMDYTEDAILYMFTPEQSVRMNTAMENGWFRNALSASSATLCAGLPLVDLSDEMSGCIGADLIVTTDNSGGVPTTYSWTVLPSTGVTFNPDNTSSSPGINFPGAGSYTITVRASNNVGVTASEGVMTVQDCVGLPENTNGQNIRISPNPVSSVLTVDATGLKGLVKLQVFSMMGERIAEFNMSEGDKSFALNVEKFASGIYILQFSNGSNIAVKRLVVAH